MLRFKVVNDGEVPSVELRLVMDGDGDVRLEANGKLILWVLANGEILRHTNFTLEELGFQLNANGKVRLNIEED